MKRRVSAKLSICILFLAVDFLTPLSPLVGQAQNNSTGNLADTVWDTEKSPRQNSNSDNSVTTVVYFLGFYKQGKAKINVIYDKSAGATEKYEYEYVTNNDGKTEYRPVRKLSRSLPSVNHESLEGTYQIKGTIVHLDFPSFTINATVTATSIDGVLNHKRYNQDEPVSFTKTAKPNNSSDANSSSNSGGSSGANKTPSGSAVDCYVFGIDCTPSPYAGTYGGAWSVSEQHTGSWTLSIDTFGTVQGATHDDISGRNAEISGFIDANGRIDVSCKYPNSTTKVMGTLTRKGTHLTGTLTQYSGDRIIATLSTDLSKR
ncbi:MAG: hypothetical protein JWM21_3534 [Acidobacteria bacterium]|nr:hypothetical protein [Acidobacteriota bacterium]